MLPYHPDPRDLSRVECYITTHFDYTSDGFSRLVSLLKHVSSIIRAFDLNLRNTYNTFTSWLSIIYLLLIYFFVTNSHYVCRSVTRSANPRNVFGRNASSECWKTYGRLMYTRAQWNFQSCWKGRERERERGEYRRYVELTRANISWALYWKPIFMTLRPHVLAILLRSFPPSSAFCVHFECGYVYVPVLFPYPTAGYDSLIPRSSDVQRNVLGILNGLNSVYRLPRLIRGCESVDD